MGAAMTFLPRFSRTSPSRREYRTVSLVLALTLFGAHFSSLSAQDKLEKAAWVAGSVVALGVYDYFGYNLTQDRQPALTIYRISFVLAQAGLTYLLYEKFGLPSAIGFNLIWWTFGVDMVYYGVCEMNPDPGGTWPGRGAWAAESREGLKFAHWTPVGLLRGAREGDPIARNTIVAQAVVGFALGISISISF